MTSILPPRCKTKTGLSGSWCSEAMRRNFGTAPAQVLYPVAGKMCPARNDHWRPHVSTRPLSRTAVLCACAALAVVLAGCGGSSSGGNQSVRTGGANAAAVAKLSSELKNAGTIKVATDASYAPNEVFASDNKTVQEIGRAHV